MPHFDDDYSFFTGFDPGFGNQRDFSFSFDELAGGKRKKLFSDLDLDQAMKKEEVKQQSKQETDLKKQKRKAGLQSIMTMLPSMVQTLTARDERSLQNALENASQILERRMSALAEQKEREKERQHEVSIRESERVARKEEAKEERGHQTKLQETEIGSRLDLENVRGAREKELLSETQKFTLKLEESRNKFDLDKLELQQKNAEELQRRGLAHDTELFKFNIANQTREQLRADGLSIEAADEVAGIVGRGGSFKDLRPSTQAALTMVDSMNSARNLAELNLLKVQALAGIHSIRVPITEASGEVGINILSREERTRPLTHAEVLAEFDPDYALNLLRGLGAKLPPEEMTTDDDKTVAQVNSEKDEVIGQRLSGSQSFVGAVNRVVGSSNPNEAAADLGAVAYKTVGYNDRIAISMINSSKLPEDLKEIARKQVFELKKRLEEEKRQESLDTLKDPSSTLNFGQYPGSR